MLLPMPLLVAPPRLTLQLPVALDLAVERSTVLAIALAHVFHQSLIPDLLVNRQIKAPIELASAIHESLAALAVAEVSS